MTAIRNTQALSKRRWVVMGVSGCGKSSVGSSLAQSLNLTYLEGDSFHPLANINKMAAGIPLTDQDRQGWLEILQQKIFTATQQGEGLVLSCSALKRRYRDVLRQGDPDVCFVYLQGERSLIAARMQVRSDHFMPVTLLDSQFRDLEPPQSDENAITVNIANTPEHMLEQILAAKM